MAALKRVCIVGAGPSGLVAAKTLIHEHPGRFHVTIYEKGDRIGGLWPVSKQDDGMVNPDMCTNQSRHTVSFSDLAWPENAPVFPKAWQVGQYLQRYVEKYPGYEIKLGIRVERASYEQDQWEVTVVDTKASGVSQTVRYEHLIVASGFFGKPKMARNDNGSSLTTARNVWHSSHFRDISCLQLRSNAKNIVVVGGQMSGVEVAASIAHQISSQAVAPGTGKYAGYTVTHVIQQPLWVMPLFFPLNPKLDQDVNPAPDFLPLDFVSYNLAVRPPGNLLNSSGKITEEKAKITHDFMERSIGSDQSDLGVRCLSMDSESSVRSTPPYLAISDTYTEFVRSGNINVIQGRLKAETDDKVVIIEAGGRENVIDDVSAVVLATGFEPAPSLSFLPHEMLRILFDFDSTSDAFPLALNVHATVSRKIPSLGFVGFYRSPYWGVMEMQARLLGKLWSGDSAAVTALETDTTLNDMLKLRHDPLCAQFPMGDYAYLMESFSQILGIRRYEPEDPSQRTGIVFPARYAYEGTHETKSAIKSVYDSFSLSPKRKYLARATFRAMQGDWNLNRKITSFNAKYPSGTLSGSAKLIPRNPTADGACDMEYFYLEEGLFITTTGLKLGAKRSYVFRYCEAKDKITAWFTKEDRSVDYFFHELEFSRGQKGWVAKASHWCQPDQYEVEYEFRFKGATLTYWSWRYKVKGPDKDYEAFSEFTR